MEKIIIRVARALNRALERFSETTLPLLITALAVMFIYFGIKSFRGGFTFDCENGVYGGIVGLVGGVVLWAFAILSSMNALYKK